MPGTSERPELFVAMQPVPEARSWAEKVASRLWMLQTSFADDPPSARHEYLVEEIERSIKDVGESRRSEYLSALMERFPGPERIDAPYFKPPEVETVERSPQEVADELIARLPEFSKEAKAGVRRCLVEFMRAVLRARSKKSFLREQDSAGATNQIENWSSLAVMTTFASSRSIVFSANILLSGSLRNHDRMSYRRPF